ncbi:MAG: hypothetical protein IPL45_11010 [Actinomycetales bacterium]|nr:hypothetical protein [Actinomycetales bacterium]
MALSVGIGAHRVELAVGHPAVPDRWLAAVESDGPEYAALPGVRARDVLRPRQLRAMGWRPLRVWSTDLFRDPAPEVVRVVAVVKALVREGDELAAAERRRLAAEVRGTVETGASEQVALAEQSPDEQIAVAEQSADEQPLVASPDEQSPVATKKRARRFFRRASSERSSDDTDTGWGDTPRSDDESTHEQWLKDQRPPHWE